MFNVNNCIPPLFSYIFLHCHTTQCVLFLKPRCVVHIQGKLVKAQRHHLAWRASSGHQLLQPSAFVDEKTETNLHFLCILSLGISRREQLWTLFTSAGTTLMVIFTFSDVVKWFILAFSQNPHWFHALEILQLKDTWSFVEKHAGVRFVEAEDSNLTGTLTVVPPLWA